LRDRARDTHVPSKKDVRIVGERPLLSSHRMRRMDLATECKPAEYAAFLAVRRL
jgi:hypothetical protein